MTTAPEVSRKEEESFFGEATPSPPAGARPTRTNYLVA